MIAGAGSRSPGRWWSVTSTSMPARGRGGDALVARDAVVDGDDQARRLRARELDDLGRQAVAVLEAVRHEVVDVRAHRAQAAHADRAGGRAVGVVVGDDDDAFSRARSRRRGAPRRRRCCAASRTAAARRGRSRAPPRCARRGRRTGARAPDRRRRPRATRRRPERCGARSTDSSSVRATAACAIEAPRAAARSRAASDGALRVPACRVAAPPSAISSRTSTSPRSSACERRVDEVARAMRQRAPASTGAEHDDDARRASAMPTASERRGARDVAVAHARDAAQHVARVADRRAQRRMRRNASRVGQHAAARKPQRVDRRRGARRASAMLVQQHLRFGEPAPPACRVAARREAASRAAVPRRARADVRVDRVRGVARSRTMRRRAARRTTRPSAAKCAFSSASSVARSASSRSCDAAGQPRVVAADDHRDRVGAR